MLHPMWFGKSFCLPEIFMDNLVKEGINPCHLTEIEYHTVKTKFQIK